MPQQARSTERLHRIYDATGRVLADGGIEALSITAVATEAGIRPASVYDYVADSRALLAAFVTQRFDDSGHEMAEVLVPAATLDEALANVRKVFRVYFDLMRRDRGFRIAIAASQADDELVRISFEDSQRNAGHLRAMLVPFLGAESGTGSPRSLPVGGAPLRGSGANAAYDRRRRYRPADRDLHRCLRCQHRKRLIPAPRADDSTRRRPPAAGVARARAAGVVVLGPAGRAGVQDSLGVTPDLLTSSIVVDALRVSLVTSLGAAALSLVLGLPLAWVLARTEFPGRRLLRAIVTLPMVLPPVVGGAALLFALGRRGLIGEPLYDASGFLFPFSVWGVILANTFVAMPFLVITLEAAFRTLDPQFEAAAATLGAGRFTVFRRVTLPLVALAGCRCGVGVGTCARRVRATITFAGNLQGRTQTLPLAVYLALQSDVEAAVATSLVLVAVSLIVLLVLKDRWWQRA
ncbi:MAG: ABC transporter permease subunit [Acidimicrobiales bacterium]